jgi:hypothetical protein
MDKSLSQEQGGHNIDDFFIISALHSDKTYTQRTQCQKNYCHLNWKGGRLSSPLGYDEIFG